MTNTVRSTTVRARVAPELKAQAESILEKLGIIPSQAINMLYAQIALHRGLPFESALPAATSSALADARKGKVKKVKDANALFRDLNS